MSDSKTILKQIIGFSESSEGAFSASMKGLGILPAAKIEGRSLDL